MLSIKHQLHALCLASIEERIKSVTEAIQFAQTSANEETKNSAGDKYETGRAMAQLEIEKNMAQLAEAQKLKQLLIQLDPNKTFRTIQHGSLVTTNHERFYISIPAGKFTIENINYFAISPSSPIAQKMLMLREDDEFIFNKRDFMIRSIV